MKFIDSNIRNFDKKLETLILKRRDKIQSKKVSILNIIKDVKKNGDRALLKYERKFNQSNLIFPTKKQISKSIHPHFGNGLRCLLISQTDI